MAFRRQHRRPDERDSRMHREVVIRRPEDAHRLTPTTDQQDAIHREWSESDKQIARRLGRVPVPAERRERIQSRLAQDSIVGLGSSSAEDNVEHGASRNGPDEQVRDWPGRRRMAGAFGAVACVACLVLVGHFLWGDPWDRVSPAQLVTLAGASNNEAPWQRVQFGEEGVYPVSSFLQSSPVRWQAVAHPLDPKAVRYQLAGPTRDTFLYVLRPGRPVSQLPSLPPEQPQAATGTKRVAAWQEGAFVYVLTMRDATADYWDLIRKRSGSVARTRGRRASS